LIQTMKNTNRPMKTALTSEGLELKNYRTIDTHRDVPKIAAKVLEV
jgi:hypothetical protein